MEYFHSRKTTYMIIILINIGILCVTDFSRISNYYIFDKGDYEFITGMLAVFSSIHSVSIIIWILLHLFANKKQVGSKYIMVMQEINELEESNKIHRLEIQKFKLEMELNKRVDEDI